ncbi:MAG: redoxin domain-containing protein [Sphingobacteriales bacterium]
MKNLKTLALLAALFAFQPAFSQTGAHLNLSGQFPAAGEKISITYNPAGTVVEGKDDISAVVYYLDNKDYPAADVDLKQDGKLLKGDITIPDSAKAFFIRISSAGLVDNNDDKGYVFLVYKDKQPVRGAYAAEAMIFSGLGNNLAKIKTDLPQSIVLYQKEFALYPQSEKGYGTNYYFLLAGKPENKAIINQKISELEKSADEKDLMLASNLLGSTKQSAAADSLNAVIKTRFPAGSTVKNEIGMAIYNEKDLNKKDSLFNIFISKYPETAEDKYTVAGYLPAQLAGAYLKKDDFVNFHKYEKLIQDKSMVQMTLNNVAWEWALAGEHLDDAEKLSKQTVDFMAEKVKIPSASAYTSLAQAKRNNQNTYDMFADTYAYILYKENKPKEALKYMQVVYDRTPGELNSIEHYVQILGEDGQYAKAMEIADKSIRLGQNSNVLKDELKKDYIKVKGSDAGYDQYIAPLEKALKDKVLADLAKTMIDQPAPLFALKDLNGKSYSLSELKGKVVIVDFWATWCGPCKASLPGMQMAVNKYKDNPDVIFLFVDTWEEGDNYLPVVKKFIADNNYAFNVLLDEKGEDGRQSKVVSSFGVDGIPTKFVIDKNGHIRFKYVGYTGTPETLVEEVSSMVDMAGNPDAALPAPKTSSNK